MPVLRFQGARAALGGLWYGDVVKKITNLNQQSLTRTLPSGGLFNFGWLGCYTAKIRYPKGENMNLVEHKIIENKERETE
jgi:hypothetical protein